ncbi:sulfatase-like hydrolase/transferase [Pseudoflavitalea sp. G-6-1-2]|uniref:sulfatase-like hydrolase/transferase n=1 Tax=Pseudoflavitalea sp. G-6-1-2 TaxID=2728841 RepID=UPI00146C8179|nr:sulfatase-like hydrolase/transferase [Pseudoflavitalea sp. G-6-1-2]NML21128.1 sulfatase-like hydrolase/transferase [Pseudoflavitalea sp. G-6-1-2]
MKEALRSIPFYAFLLPLFFVLHGFVELWSFHSFADYLPLLLLYTGCTLIVLLLFRWITGNWRKAALITTFLTGFYLFFGAIFDFLKAHSPFAALYKYSVLTVSFLILAILLFIWLRRTTSSLYRITFFLNLLLLIYLGLDLFTAIRKSQTQTSRPVITAPNAANGIIADSIEKPDIYLLVFDGYSSTYGLKQFFGYDNSELDSFLISRKFHNLPASRSNYTATVFSMASQLNLDYLTWLDARKFMTKKEYAQCAAMVYDNEVMRVLKNNGYEIANHSIFDLKDHPSYADQDWRTIHANILAEGTFGSRVLKEFRWMFTVYPALAKLMPFFTYEDQYVTVKQLLNGIVQESSIKSKQPKFVYGHVLLPHHPYYRDKNGKDRSQEMLNDPNWQDGPDNPYTGYIKYANTEIRKLVDSIQINTNGKAVIIVESDHGFHYEAPPEKKHNVWYNVNAVYLPNGQYGQFMDSITNVNEFRIIFNTLFHQQYPMLKDSLLRIYH